MRHGEPSAAHRTIVAHMGWLAASTEQIVVCGGIGPHQQIAVTTGGYCHAFIHHEGQATEHAHFTYVLMRGQYVSEPLRKGVPQTRRGRCHKPPFPM